MNYEERQALAGAHQSLRAAANQDFQRGMSVSDSGYVGQNREPLFDDCGNLIVFSEVGLVSAALVDLNAKESCIFKVAINLEDVNLCKTNLNETRKNSCLAGIAVTTHNPELCEEITLEGRSKDYCYRHTK
ncbi:hypothetical protein HN592_04475 [Candidatus Woesearchaeota archaeon]|jgi:hypothetical protein|nr:hypothetical protein [Candidatus Woesearchaeota archaeon]MBT4368467.1 hypothetical protein [Candidatus Woesearchaeota archaeon]MBT4712956.1 hypothetical protein [Candidatus Woesearchaeota archaeon]MBT6639868.1 hypothetical protein [Candidatus Woesearchaeota archaeon]MBT7134040.1 hypothetical protein [Candidatus Woesearchaeota archaeon]